MFKRPKYHLVLKRISEPRRFIQVLVGPRQTGKTTLARQIMAGLKIPSHYASADEPALKDRVWIEQQWGIGRTKTRSGPRRKKVLLILDEIQKIPDWSETVKRLWDEDSTDGLGLQVIILGSSALLVQRGLTESLAGRFEVIPLTHWSFSEMKKAFGWNIEQYVFYGGYPGAAGLITDHGRWSRYIVDSLIETTISKDSRVNLFYQSNRNCEVNFVLQRGNTLIAIEVKSGRRRFSLPGIETFSKAFKVKRRLLVGTYGIPLNEFLLIPPEEWLD